MEHRKAATGGLEFFLVVTGGQICGAVGVIHPDSLLRMKNLIVSKFWRKRGIGSAVTRAIADYGVRFGCDTLGLWAIDGGPAVNLYRALGFTSVE